MILRKGVILFMASMLVFFSVGCASQKSGEEVPKKESAADVSGSRSQSTPTPQTPSESADDTAHRSGEVMEEDLTVARAASGIVSPVMIRQVQHLLNALRFNAGPADGKMGPQTVRAVKAYQKSRGLLVDGLISDALQNRLRQDVKP